MPHRVCVLFRCGHGIEGTVTATGQSAGPQVVDAGDLACSDQKVHAGQDDCASPEASGRSEHLVIHAASVSGSVDSTTFPWPPESRNPSGRSFVM
jgi:hypothetical protein